MADDRSPLFWNNDNKAISLKANTFLVDLSFSLLNQIKIIKHPKKQDQGDIVTRKEKIKGQINSILA